MKNYKIIINWIETSKTVEQVEQCLKFAGQLKDNDRLLAYQYKEIVQAAKEYNRTK